MVVIADECYDLCFRSIVELLSAGLLKKYLLVESKWPIRLHPWIPFLALIGCMQIFCSN